MKIKKLVVFIVMVVMLSTLLSSCGLSTIKIIEKKLDIELGKEDQVIYEINNIGAFGDGIRFCLISIKDEPLKLINKYFIKVDKQLDELKKDFEKKIKYFSFQLKLPDDYIIDFSNEHYWYGENSKEGIFMVYYISRKQLYFFENNV